MAMQYHFERERTNYLWIIMKKFLEEKKAELFNKEREKQELIQSHQIEIKQKKQMIKHILFQNQDKLTELKKQKQITLKNVEDENRVKLREYSADTRSLQIQIKEQKMRQSDFLRSLQKKFDQDSTNLRAEYERITNEIKNKYNYKMKVMREEFENRRKQLITEIENRKNERVTEIKNKHQEDFQKLKNYFNEITNANLDLLKQLKAEVNDKKRIEDQDIKHQYDLEVERKKYEIPLNKLKKEIDEKQKEREKQKVDKKSLEDINSQIIEEDEKLQELKWQHEVRFQQFQYLEKEKKELFQRFNETIHELHQKSGLKNLILEKKLETIADSIETKDSQLNQVLTTAKIDPSTLGIIKTTLDEVEALKNESIKEIQQELKKIREAHSNMVKTYEGKLAEFGIPVEELGFDPLVPANVG